ncbi:MAG: helix-turn-helix domain-containing protein [Micropepsaceae bacterium]
MDAKANILNAARLVFARFGYRRTSMAMVAEEAQLSRQAIYHHFPSKEALFAGLVGQLQQAALDAVKLVQSSIEGRSLPETLFRSLNAYHKSLASSVSGSEFAAELFDESARHCSAIVSAHAKRLEVLLKAIVRDAIKKGSFGLAPGTTDEEFIGLLLVASKGVKLANVNAGARAHELALKKMVFVICAGVGAEGSAETAKPVFEVKMRRVAK